jgi:hypothetical protein
MHACGASVAAPVLYLVALRHKLIWIHVLEAARGLHRGYTTLLLLLVGLWRDLRLQIVGFELGLVLLLMLIHVGS